MSIGDKIRERRAELKMTQEELATKLGYKSKSTINKIELGINDIPLSKVSEFATALSTTVAYLMEWESADDSPETPLYEAAAGEGRYNDGYPSEVFDLHLEPEEFSFRVCGRSMEPTILDGDIVIVSAQSIIDYPRQMALVRINGEESTIKRVEVKSNGIMLIADNVDVYSPRLFTPEEIEMLPVQIVGVVTKLFRRYR